ncbi:hypothetical protein PK35_07350 [Tamlana nanhaiensis]|uniref:Carrier domain-containing protein n=1 Tax=Neotamlana nanhaiensis TaxID=1382798 RepID=A0A0D7W760_9FLAO|nr:hypothetical protein PK35_07350 [Tamlana nanhaiensis]
MPKNTAFNPFYGPEIEHVIKTTKAQFEILLDCKLGGDDAKKAFNIPCTLKFNGQLNVDALNLAVKTLIKRHESLRSSFSENGEYMNIFTDIDFEINYDDLSSLPSTEAQEIIDEKIKNNADFLFDIIHGPLFNINLLKSNTSEYYLLINFFHGICDGLSVDSFLRELSLCYSAYTLNKEPELPEIKPYSEFAIKENLFLNSDAFNKSEAFWLNMYQNSIPEVNLPLDFDRPKIRTYNNGILHHKLKPSTLEKLKEVGIQNGASLVTTFLSAFEIFLNQLTKQNDLVVGLSTSRQAEYNMIGMIGHTANVLPLRSKIDKTVSFNEYLNSKKTSLYDAYENQGISFGHLLQKLKVPRDFSRIPLVPVMVNIELNNGLEGTFSFEGVKHELLKTYRNYATFEIELQAHLLKDGPNLGVNFNTSLFKPSSIKNMMGNFEVLINNLIEAPDVPLNQIFENKNSDKYNLLNNTQSAFPNLLLHELFDNQANKTPNNLAFTFKENSFKYSELSVKTNQIAHYLVTQNVEPGDTIAVSLSRCPELVPILLAILQCGATYVPLDPNFPKSRLDFMLEDCGAKYLITASNLENAFSDEQPKLIIDNLFNTVQSFPETKLNLSLSQETIAYILYTSGSTGKPKGVSVTHKNLVNFLTSMAKEPGITETDTLLSITTMSFDIAGLELFLPLINGATLHLADDDTAKDGRLLLELLQNNNISILQATPTTWQMLIDVGWKEYIPLKVLCGGEALPLSLATKLLNLCDELWNMYGPTETTIWSSTKQIKLNDDLITIGKPIDNTQIYILNENLELVSPGEIGEITIAGDGVALGYLNRPELTAEKFVKNPFSTNIANNPILYRTGDLGKLLPNGELQCLGRSDQQVKIRGFRIELGEIEQALTLTNEIQSAAVIAQNNKLIAYIVLEKGLTPGDIKISDIKNEMADNLPDYFMPQEFNILDNLPKTLNGKIDRKALHKPETEKIPETTFTGPRTKAEKIVSSIWQNCLNIPKIDIFSDFFELGGQSIIAVKVMTLLEEETGKRLPLASLFSHPTIEKLALLLDMDNRFITWDSLVPIKKGGSKTPLYIVHGAGMNVLIFNALAKNLDDDQPVFALQAKGLNGIDKPHESVPEMAAHYIEAILKQNPNGAFALAGYSFGGIIAYEMAKQLQKKGKRLTMLAMLDTYVSPAYNYKSRFRKKIAALNYRVKSNFYVLSQMITSWEHSKIRINSKKRAFKNLMLRLKYGKEKQHETVNNQPYLLDKMNMEAIRKYKIEPGDFKVDLFRVEDSSYYMHDREFLGWNKIARKGVEVHNIPGDHVQLFSPPNDKKSALILQNILDERDAEQFSAI